MHVVKMDVVNYGPFVGSSEVDLAPTVYGVTAKHESDAGRSNWLGKSWAMGAIRFALYGAHAADSEDDVIHRGAKECAVYVTLSDGTTVQRSRQLGKSTRLSVDIAAQGTVAVQDRAQEAIEKHLRMTLADFDASCFIQQKQIARLVVARPAERTDIVNAWLELEPLIQAEELAKDCLREVLEKRAAIEVKITTLQEVVAKGMDDQECLTLVERLEVEAKAAQERRAVAARRLGDEQARQHHVERSEEFEATLERGRNLKEALATAKGSVKLSEDETALSIEYEGAKVNVTLIQTERSECSALASGQFSGQCPVMRKPCPAKEAVESTRVDAAKRLRVLDASVGEARATVEELRADVDQCAEDRRTIERLEQELKFVRERAEGLASADDYLAEHPSLGPLPDLLAVEREATEEAIQKTAELKAAQNGLKDWEAARKAIKQLRSKVLVELDGQAATAKEAVDVLRGARKDLATQALAEIEVLANGLLQQASIDISLKVSWAKEGKGLATNCDSCGAPFPTSTKVRECTVCQSPRGPKLIERLDLTLSNRSGAADDMAGLAFQLAASSWLRKKRGSDWGVVFVDEPFGALDETNTRNLSNHLHALIRGAFGFEQGFLVAHDSSIMGAMPARLVVTSNGVSSKLEAV